MHTHTVVSDLSLAEQAQGSPVHDRDRAVSIMRQWQTDSVENLWNTW